jgi:hypothetical protein
VLPAQLVYFLHLEIHPKDLNACTANDLSAELMNEESRNLNGYMGEQNNQVTENANLHGARPGKFQ